MKHSARKILSVVLALAMILSIVCVGSVSVSAAEESTAMTINFELPTDWGTGTVSCYLWEYGATPANENAAWQAKASKCTKVEGQDNLYSYTFDSTKGFNCVIFSLIGGGKQSYDLTLTPDCNGDTVYIDGAPVENPVDSTKLCYIARWRNNQNNGPVYQENTSGVSIGEYVFDESGVPVKYVPEEETTAPETSIETTTAPETSIETTTAPETSIETTTAVEVTTVPVTTTEPTKPTEPEGPIAGDPTVYGDSNLDGTVKVTDATLVQKYAADLALFSAAQITVSDVNADGKVNVKDATSVQKWLASLESDERIGQPVNTATPDEPTTAATPDEPTTQPTTAATGYYVAGEAKLTGVEWKENDPSGAMVKNEDGTYSLTFKGIAAGTYAYKVTNGTWDVSYNENGLTNDTDNKNNASVSVSDTCDVTITFDPATEKVSATGEFVYVVTSHTYTVAGAEALLGTNWDPTNTANDMTEVSDGVYQLVINNVDAFAYEFKVVQDHSWGTSWGEGTGNCVANVEKDGSTVTITFTLATGKVDVVVTDGNIDPTEPATSEPTTTAPATSEPATSAPVTSEPATSEPATSEPATSAPVTSEPTTTAPVTSEPTTTAPTADYYVAGEVKLTGVEWKANDASGAMTENEDGTYSKTFKDVVAGTYAYKVTNGTWDVSYNENGLTNNTDNNKNASVSVNATGDVTITFDPATGKVTATGDHVFVVTDHTYTVAGAEDLLGTQWDPTNTANDMTEISDGVYQLVINNVDAFAYEFKVAQDHSWGTSWGDPTSSNGNCVATVTEDGSTVTITFTLATGTVDVVVTPPATV